ncbi:hypothetical protein CDD82_7250 [Ophiocordyceps australis]|uniref:AAA+ ATPase domain-containing protein n=1 Tax=Ophiocordyceps australis TaxID=1399860 RepID=A0A2C5YN86_9HYPO|nr:hypothetical protein CDD82_7250 [Ophiocordyceps australis]
MRRFSTALTITDPLVKYQTLVKSGVYAPDQAQHRLARHLRSVYLRIKDYSPHAEYRQRLNQVARLTDQKPLDHDDEAGSILARRNHGIWRNPLFSHLLPTAQDSSTLALTRVLSGHEAAVEIDSPKGLFVSGEVGTGKSMLLDLLADGLPSQRKRRWHFNTFMLYTLSQLEKHRASQASGHQFEYSLAWMGKKLVDESPILFLDEFQLPDRAASKILSHLFIIFFQLGGVLVASSNRMPEELQKASGVDYAPGPARRLMHKMLGSSHIKGELYGQSSDFSNFLQVLKARCDFWQMEGANDWRRTEEAIGLDSSPVKSTAGSRGLTSASGQHGTRKRPHHYHLMGKDDDNWGQTIRDATSWTGAEEIWWEPSSLVVYGRRISIPQHHKGFVLWQFARLVEAFGPADYTTLASSYHTFIVDEVPVLTVLDKNEARRFITFLDALYEARCKLVIRAASPPDDLFFPSTPGQPHKTADLQSGDATYSETVAEVYQDQMSPFRPNISYYDSPTTTRRYNPDQDSDFGLERPQVDFINSGAFTGEDERFAYKRAASRLWELCSARWHARTGDWWRPLPREARHWEAGPASSPLQAVAIEQGTSSGEGMGKSVEVDEVAGLSKWRMQHVEKQSRGGGRG